MQPAVQDLTPITDDQAVARVVAGDAAAFELLMRRHNQRLYRVARSVVRNDHEAEDVVQDAFVRAYSSLGRFEGRSSVATWLSRIALHEALRRRRRLRQAAAALSSHQLSRSDAVARGECLAMTDDSQTRRSVTAALDALPAGMRTVLVLRLVQGLSTQETAECLRLSEANVKVRLHRGKQMLAETLGGDREPDARDLYSFGAERCDRVVNAVFHRLGVTPPPRVERA